MKDVRALRKMRIAGVVALSIAVSHALADPLEPDAEGCADMPYLGRVSDCWIDSCWSAKSDEARLQVGAIDDSGEARFRTLKGRTQTITYACPIYVSESEVLRGAREALQAAGFAPVFSGETPLFDHAIATWRAGDNWIQVEAAEYCAGTMYFQTSVSVRDTAGQRDSSTE